MIALLERKRPIPVPEVTTPRTLTTIRPPSFSLRSLVYGARTLISQRDLLYTLTLFRLTVRYKQSILGWVWVALQPLAMMIIYTFVFSHVAKVKSEGVPYPLFAFSALLPWIFFSSAISNAINGLVGHANLLTKLYFPREIIPLSYVFAAFVDFMISCFILSGTMAYYHVSPSWNALYALPITVILIAFTVSISLFFSSIFVRFRDIAPALPVLLQIGVFVTPVAYSIDSVPPRLRRLYLLNPLASLIDNFRRVVVHGAMPDLPMLMSAGAITLCCLVMAYAYFKANETTMSDFI